MTTLTQERMPALLSYGFRPMFLLAGLWAVIEMALWIGMLTGQFHMPTLLDPVAWHGHEFLFGYLGAVVAGFLLTAVPSWTNRPPLAGWPLAGLALLWLAGRLAIATSENSGAVLAIVLDLAFPVLLAGAVLREIIAAKNWKNLIVLALLGLLIFSNVLFWLAALNGDAAATGVGMRLGIATAVLMIVVIGGRIVPAFTRNWLTQRQATALPAPPMQPFDKAAVLVSLPCMFVWVLWPSAWITIAALGLFACMHVIRLARWRGLQTRAEPLLMILHVGYGLVPFGAILMLLAVVAPDAIGPAAALHVWTGGAVALMTLAVMTRATLGHSGRPLHADAGTCAIYGAILAALCLRVLGGVLPDHALSLYALAGLCWLCAFLGFLALYSPLLLNKSPAT